MSSGTLHAPALETALIVGFGDIGERVAKRLSADYRVLALIRNAERAPVASACGAIPLLGDLALPETLRTLGELADTVFHFAPPPGTGAEDTHTRHLLATIGGRAKKLIYISTTGVYGDCGGEWIDETQNLNPQTDRAGRRVDAELALTEWANANASTLTILRAPGIYAGDRLPLARLRAGTPAIMANEDAWSNHIHADDLAQACCLAMQRTTSATFNIVDNTQLKMGDYFDLVADHYGLARPPRITRGEAERVIGAPMLSFMRESRRIGNRKMIDELGVRLDYPTVSAFLETLPRRSYEP
jgi:nucleoside-diphosphate-sugar epimerase